MNGHLKAKSEEIASLEATLKNYKRDSENKTSNLSIEFEEYRKKVEDIMNAQGVKITEY